VLIVQVAWFEKIFETVPLTLSQWGLVLAVPLSLLVVEEIRKLFVRARRS
jgi:hypothetical protein